jgi:hypothetical protein
MASGRPRRPNDPSVMASVESALRSVARPGPLGLAWNWRYELGLIAGVALVALAGGYELGAAGLLVITAVGLSLLAAALAWAPSRRRLIARIWCVITPHRVRTGCRHSWVQSRDGKLPVILYTTPAAFGERVTLWCRAGITGSDLAAARDILRAACWASDVRVVASERYRHIVVLEVVRHLPAKSADDVTAKAWPYLDRDGEADGADPEEPALSGGAGHHRPFG